MIKHIIILALIASCGMQETEAQSTTSGGGLIACRVTSGGLLSGDCTSASPLVATVTKDSTITGVGSAGSPYTTTIDVSGIFNGFYGPGVDGALTYSGAAVLGVSPAAGTCQYAGYSTYVLTRDLFATNLTVNSGIAINTNSFRVFVSGTLTNNGMIANHGGCPPSSAQTGGTTPSNFYTGLTGGGAVVGGTGNAGISNTTAPLSYTANAVSNAGAPNTVGGVGQVPGKGGGGGGAISSQSGGSGGSISNMANSEGAIGLMEILHGCGMHSGVTLGFVGTGGGAGGAETAGGTPLGGPGGGGGGTLFVAARLITGSGVFSSKGGNGAPGSNGFATTNSGGGGGGGGGGVALVYNSRSGSTTINATGGSPGAGSGTGKSGGAGADGIIYTFNLSGDGT